MLTANILMGSLLLVQNYESLADFAKNSSSEGELQISKDQCYGVCNQIKPIMSHIGNVQSLENRSEARINIFENRLRNMEAQLAAFDASRRKPKPDLAKFVQIGSRYFYVDKMNKLNWFAASKACREMGGKLAIIQDKTELNQIHNMVKWLKGLWLTCYWLGINALVEKEHFNIWPSSVYQSNKIFLKWLFPTNTHHYRCVKLCGYEFLDCDCNENRHFICEAVFQD